jgi:hypothetical protein
LADPGDFWFWAVTLGVAVLGGGWYAFRWLHVARLVEDTPTSRIRSAAQGYVELAGRCKPLGGIATNPAPLTQRPCVWWRYRVQEKVDTGPSGKRRRSWRTVNSGYSELPFLLDDGTGECIVQPMGAEVIAAESTTWYGDTPWPTQAPGEGLLRPQGHRYRYFEERIYEHEQVYVLGQFRSHSPRDREDREAEVRALLAEWKRDQAKLTERFDANRDGKVSLEEWENARQAARLAVTRRHVKRPAEAAVHVVGRPEGGQLFLVSAFPEREIARRYRRRALLAFAGFVVATYALGWLLQGVFG